MKKQFLLLILLILSSMATSYAQTCQPGPLNPAAGTPYTYSVLINNPPYDPASGAFTWYVTQDVNLLSGNVTPNNGDIIATGTYNSPAIGQSSIQITWTAQAIINSMTNPYYIVIKFAGSNAGICNAMNMKVWQVKPINMFLLAINVFNNTDKYCAADVTSAVVNPSGPTVNYQYGVNTLYARVTPKNYTGDWWPSFRIDGLDAAQAVAAVNWATDSLFTTLHATTIAGNVATSLDAHTSAFDGSAKLYLKIDIANNYFECLADEAITVGVDGVIKVGASVINDVKSETDCSDEIPFGKTVPLTIKARPTITPSPAVGPFIPKQP